MGCGGRCDTSTARHLILLPREQPQAPLHFLCGQSINALAEQRQTSCAQTTISCRLAGGAQPALHWPC
eukprot:364597-Chlamydomonas_euryale.AAC.5